MTKVRFLLVLIPSLIILTACQQISSENFQIIKINNSELKVEVVANQQDIARGLSGRSSLCPACGMLFEFSDYQIRNFWMKEMNFPLDIIWIKDDQIVGIEKDVPLYNLEGEISRVQSKEAVNKVLEVNSGWVDDNNIKNGEIIEYLTIN